MIGLALWLPSLIPPPPKGSPTPIPTPTATLPPNLPKDNLPAIQSSNAEGVVALAWMAHCGTGLALAWAPDGKTLALVGQGSVAGNVCLYDTTALDAPPRLLGGPGGQNRRSIAFSPGGKVVASGGDDGLIWLWDAATGDQRAILGGYYGQITSLAFSPEGDALASADSNGLIRIWDVKLAVERAVLAGHNGAANSIAFSRDG